MTEIQPSTNWWDEFPAPRAKCADISGGELMKLFDDMDIKPEARPFLLVDVRRADWEVSFAWKSGSSDICSIHTGLLCFREERSRPHLTYQLKVFTSHGRRCLIYVTEQVSSKSYSTVVNI
jgi:hypothetical protein